MAFRDVHDLKMWTVSQNFRTIRVRVCYSHVWYSQDHYVGAAAEV